MLQSVKQLGLPAVLFKNVTVITETFAPTSIIGQKGKSIMLRHLTIVTGLLLAALTAQAGEAGKLIFVTGSAQVAEKPAVEGAAVQEGQLLSTGANGFMYVRTVDNGLFILRPNTRARIAAYHVDTVNPANTRIKLELLSGVARSRSGEAVKLARQNFRFNTPVAAIGVRGTDFTVFTDNDTSRVAVISGAIVMTGFDGACRAEGSGPCEGNASRELSAAQRGMLLQLNRGQAAPQLMVSSGVGPDQVSPARPDEPVAKATSPGTTIADISLEAKKSASLNAVAQQAQQPPVVNPPVVTPPPVIETGKPEEPKTVEPPVVQLPERTYVWGRFQQVLGEAAPIALGDELAKGMKLLSARGNYVLLRSSAGANYIMPERGSVGFQLTGGDAHIYSTQEDTSTEKVQLANGSLNVDFGARTFTTGVDLVGAETIRMTGAGTLGPDARLYGNRTWGAEGKMNIDGALTGANGGGALYIFDGRIDSKRTVEGATLWGK
jgi:hypothetical protein